MVKAVLFDLDGTLLDIDIEPFLRDYFGLLGPVVAELVGDTSAQTALSAVIAGTESMARPHPGQTNADVFDATFLEHTGLDLTAPHAAQRIHRFYAEEFPSLKGVHGPREGARSAVDAARSLGLRTALATNPIFPVAAIRERARWAGFDLEEFDAVTSYETAYACKPQPAYFRDIADRLAVAPSDCLMVGDDPVLDLSAADVGMKTYYVGSAEPVISDWAGSLESLAELLPRLG